MSGPPPPPQQQSQGDSMFMNPAHLAQQQQQQPPPQSFDNKLKTNEFANRNNLMQSAYGGPHGINLQNSIMNQQQQQQQQNSQQVKFIDFYL